MEDITLNYLVISETKLHERFPNAEFNLAEFEIRARKNNDDNGGNLYERALIPERYRNSTLKKI